MKTVLLCRNSIEGRYVANQLLAERLLDSIILERGSKARSRKLRRMLISATWWEYPFRVLDMVAIALYSTAYRFYLRRNLSRPEIELRDVASCDTYAVEDANDEDCMRILKTLTPDILLVMGTSILSPKVMGTARKYALNIHSGILPHYRNVHSEFWALCREDYDRIGTTIVHLDESIDGGDVAIQSTIDVDSRDNIMKVRLKNLLLAGSLVVEAMRQAQAGALPRSRQVEDNAGFYPTPSLLDFILLLTRH